MRLGSAYIVAALVAVPLRGSAEPSHRGIDGTTVVRGVDALRDHVIIFVSEWCTHANDAAFWREADEFNGPTDSPTVGDNPYDCRYEVLCESGDCTHETRDVPQQFHGAPWHAPSARDGIFYALPRAKLQPIEGQIAALDVIPFKKFYKQMESGKGGVLRAAVAPTRGFQVPVDSPFIGFKDVLRAEIHDKVFTLVPQQRIWKLVDGREAVEDLGDGPPPATATPAITSVPVPEAIPEPTPVPVLEAIPEPIPAPSPVAPETPPVPVPAPTSARPAPVLAPGSAPPPALSGVADTPAFDDAAIQAPRSQGMVEGQPP